MCKKYYWGLHFVSAPKYYLTFLTKISQLKEDNIFNLMPTLFVAGMGYGH